MRIISNQEALIKQLAKNNESKQKASNNNAPAKNHAALSGSSELAEDFLELSAEAKAQSVERADTTEDFRQQLEDMRTQGNELLRQLREAGKAGEGMAESMRQKLIALRIAMRISNGDNVPPEDHKFLMDFDGALYHQAVNMGIIARNSDPKDYDSLLEDSDEKDNDVQGVDSMGSGIDVSMDAALPAEPVAEAV